MKQKVLHLGATFLLLLSGAMLWLVLPTDGRSVQAETATYQTLWQVTGARTVTLTHKTATALNNFSLGVSSWDVTYCMGGSVNPATGSCSGQTAKVKETWSVDAWANPSQLGFAYSTSNSECLYSPNIMNNGGYNGLKPTFGTGTPNFDLVGSPGLVSYGGVTNQIAYERSGPYAAAIYCGNDQRTRHRGFINQFPVRWKVTGSIQP